MLNIFICLHDRLGTNGGNHEKSGFLALYLQIGMIVANIMAVRHISSVEYLQLRLSRPTLGGQLVAIHSKLAFTAALWAALRATSFVSHKFGLD